VVGWAAYTVRGFLAGLAQKSIKAEIPDRVRQVGENRQRAKGSYTVFLSDGQPSVKRTAFATCVWIGRVTATDRGRQKLNASPSCHNEDM
jgi:hypothetical protein